jgi:hypothetical protein
VNYACGEVRTAGSRIAGTTDSGETVVIEQNQIMSFAEYARDWRRVRVRWNGGVVAISATAWLHSNPVEAQRRSW